MEEQGVETDENCPCKRQRLRQGTEPLDSECRLSDLRSILADTQDREPAQPQVTPDDAGDRVPANGAQPTEQTDDKDQGAGIQPDESSMASQAMKMEIGLHSRRDVDKDSNRAVETLHTDAEKISCQFDISYTNSIKVLGFGEYDLETGEMMEPALAGNSCHDTKHQICDSGDTTNSETSKNKVGEMMDFDESGKKLSDNKYPISDKGDTKNLESSKNKDGSTFASSVLPEHSSVHLDINRHARLSHHAMDLADFDTGLSTDNKIHALAENSLIGCLEKSKFTGVKSSTKDNRAFLSTRTRNREEQSDLCQQRPDVCSTEENQNRIVPPEYLTDTGFIEMFSNETKTPESACTGSQVPETLNVNNNNPRTTGKSLFRIKPEYITGVSVAKERQGSILSPSRFTGRKQNEPFDMETSSFSDTTESSAFNSLPSSLIIDIFKFLSPCTLLRKVSSVCKYWYNLSRDSDLWRTLKFRNQHKLTDEILEQIVKFSERVWHVNLTDCRFVTDEGVKMVLSRCRYIQTLKLMRCFDLTDKVFEGVGLRRLCNELSALHIDGCYKLSDRTILEGTCQDKLLLLRTASSRLDKVAEACKNLKLLHLNLCNKVTDTGVIALSQNCHRLEQLLMNHCDKVTDKGVAELVKGCPNLLYLNFMSCGVSDAGVRQLAKLKNLTNVDLSNIPRLSPGPVMEIARSCQQLECINISLNSVMDDVCVSYLARHCRQLKRLYCVSCHVTDKGLEDIAKFCPTLEALDVGWCQDVTDSGVRLISLACKHLEYFGLIRCDKVTLETVEELVLQYPHVNYSTFILESRRLLERARREGFNYVPEDAVSLG